MKWNLGGLPHEIKAGSPAIYGSRIPGNRQLDHARPNRISRREPHEIIRGSIGSRVSANGLRNDCERQFCALRISRGERRQIAAKEDESGIDISPGRILRRDRGRDSFEYPNMIRTADKEQYNSLFIVKIRITLHYFSK